MYNNVASTDENAGKLKIKLVFKKGDKVLSKRYECKSDSSIFQINVEKYEGGDNIVYKSDSPVTASIYEWIENNFVIKVGNAYETLKKKDHQLYDQYIKLTPKHLHVLHVIEYDKQYYIKFPFAFYDFMFPVHLHYH
jgi:hypothetical protein